MYTREQIQNAFERYRIKYKNYDDAKNPNMMDFLEVLDKEILFTTPIGQPDASSQTSLHLL